MDNCSDDVDIDGKIPRSKIIHNRRHK